MQKTSLIKGITCAVIVLFILACVFPTIGGSNVKLKDISIFNEKQSKDNSIIEDIKRIGIPRGTPPEEEWNKTFGGIMHDSAHSVLQTSDGGYIVIGYTDSYGAGNGDVWLIKTDANGNEEWNKTFEGPGGMDYGTDIIQTSDGGYTITGRYSDYPPPPRDFIQDAWLIKTNANGNMEWNKTFGGTESDIFKAIQQTSDGGYIILGETSSYGAGGGDIWLVKTDGDGNELWNKTYGDSLSEYGESLQITSEGGYIFIGTKKSVRKTNDLDIWLVKTDTNGTMAWNSTYGGEDWDWGYSVQETNDTGLILVGCTGFYEDGYNLWLIKTDVDGFEQWNKTFGGSSDDGGKSVIQTAYGGYVIAGYTASYGAGYSDVWLLKTDENGIESWNITLGGSDYDGASSMKQTSEGGFIIAGRTDSYGADFSNVWLIKVARENHPPNAPRITGPTRGKAGVEYTYCIINATDPDGDDLWANFSWGDGSYSGWIGPNASGEDICASHAWQGGYYELKAKLKDEWGLESGWSPPLPIAMPKNKAFNFNFNLLEWLFERFPHMFPILRHMLGL